MARTAMKLQRSEPQARAAHPLPFILLAIVFITPLAILPVHFDSYVTTPKLAVLYFGSALLLWRAPQWWSALIGIWRVPVGRIFCSLLLLGALSLLISSAWSSDHWLSFTGTVWRRMGAMTHLVVFFIAAVAAAEIWRDRETARKLMLAMEAAGALAGVYAILQYAGVDPLIPRALYVIGPAHDAVRPPATLGHATYLATFLLPVTFIAGWFRLHENDRRLRRMHALVFLISIVGLVVTGTRSAVLGLIAGLFAFIYMDQGHLLSATVLKKALYRGAAFLVIAVILVVSPIGAGLRVRFGQWMMDAAGGPRLMVWRDSLSLLRKHLVWGIGPEMFEPEFRRAESLELARAFPDHYHESPHNLFLELALAQGVFGILFLAGMAAVACWSAVVCRRRSESNAVPIFPAMLAMFISLQFSPITITSELYVAVIVAMLAACAARQMQPAPKAAAPHTPIVPVFRLAAAVLFVIGIAYIGQEVSFQLAAARIANGDIGAAGRWYRLAWKLPMPGPNLELSRELASLARESSPPLRDAALTAAKECASAAEASGAERFNALYQSAMLAMVTNEYTRAESKLRAAIEAAPTWYRPRVVLASVLWDTGRNEEAEREASLALKCAGRKGPELKRTLDEARARAAGQVSR